jgi:hypothetical protein
MRMRLLAALALACVAPVASAQPPLIHPIPPAPGSPAYETIVDRYRSGQIDDAIKLVLRLSRYEIGALTSERRREILRGQRRDFVEAAVLLHTETFTRHRDFGYLAAEPHVVFARTVVADLLDKDERGKQFARDWYLVFVAYLHRENASGLEFLETARRAFPDDPDILTASGSAHELRTQVSSGYVPKVQAGAMPTGYERVDIDDELRRAARYYREALAAAASAEEARLRLGRVLHRLGDLDGATRELDAVRTRTVSEPFKYLATLFQAHVEDERGNRTRAADLYVAALQMHSVGQAGFVGLGQVFHADGQTDEASRVLSRMLEGRAEIEPWWVYLFGQAWHLKARLAALRARVAK